MNLIEFEGQTRVIGAPNGWDHKAQGECSKLPVLDHEWDGLPVMSSFWKPSPAELLELQNGGKIVLSIMGRGHPVVALSVSQCVAVTEIAPGGPDLRVALIVAMVKEMTGEQRRAIADGIAGWSIS